MPGEVKRLVFRLGEAKHLTRVNSPCDKLKVVGRANNAGFALATLCQYGISHGPVFACLSPVQVQLKGAEWIELVFGM